MIFLFHKELEEKVSRLKSAACLVKYGLDFFVLKWSLVKILDVFPLLPCMLFLFAVTM